MPQKSEEGVEKGRSERAEDVAKHGWRRENMPLQRDKRAQDRCLDPKASEKQWADRIRMTYVSSE